MKWHLDSALTFFRQYNPAFIAHGFNIALGGSVVEKGFSEKDLDIWVVPGPRVNPTAPEPSRNEQVANLYAWVNRDGLNGFKVVETGHWNALCLKWKLKNADGFVVELFVVQEVG